MAVSIIENWSEISGTVVSVTPSLELGGFESVEIAVEDVKDVPGFPNLLTDAAGKNLMVLMPADLVSRLAIHAGQRITCRVRRGGPDKVFVNIEHVDVS